MTKPDFARPWHVPVALSDVPEVGLHLDLAADANTRALIAKSAGLRSLPRLEASFDLHRHGADGMHVLGAVRATVGQTCVVTLEPMESEMEEAVDLLFVPRADAERGEREAEGGSVELEAMANGMVDLGTIVTEFLMLGIDPYPRKSGAEFQAPAANEPPGSAFAALAALKTDSSKGSG